MNPLYTLVAARAAHRCEYCCAPELVFNFPFEVEHIIPVSRSGTDSEDNLALACRSCNLYKGNRISGVDPETGTETRLFNPREDTWDEHFQVEPQSGAITGITAIARVTITALELNSPLQLAARQIWVRLSLFP
ncbi:MULTISPECIES: HNH endonuclease [Leptolyngbya]|uniref:HNH endonuclease n=1 Tax=Leptolyngbya TaxID=47251 RepID=UPI001681E43B|nr:HNH endonuclease signature motif containing protein [Leptolyngbya sp. FACHB-1624]MBD1854492.1 HNH endonuclease [Leptolyngbya sp. FACHB-1624]